MLHLKTAKLSRWQVRLIVVSGLVLLLTGIAWLLLHHFGQREGEFGPETNPLEPWMLRLHGAAMIASLLGVGSLLVVHVWRGWQYRSQRLIGIVLSTGVAWLILSGYLLYYVADEEWRAWLSISHWVAGLTGLPVFILHYTKGQKVRRSS